MSLYGMMRTGVSGMNAQANRLSTVADNIANSGTTGYKRSSTEFSSLIIPSTSGNYTSGGVTTTIRTSISQQGDLRYTSSGSDLAINGDGFFVVQNSSGTPYLTRAGSFVPDGQGNLVNAAGFYLMGYSFAAGPPAATANGFGGLERVSIAQNQLLAVPSTQGLFVANLPVGADDVPLAQRPSQNAANATPTQKTSLVVYDNLGSEVMLDIHYTKTGPNTWEVAVFNQAGAAPGAPFPYAPGSLLTTASLTFDATTGKLTAPTGGVNVAVPNGGTFNLDISGLTQLGMEYTELRVEANGNAPSGIESIEIGSDGTMYAQYENGSFRELYRIPLANVQSPDRLNSLPGNVYTPSADSGDLQMGFPGSGGLGAMISGALENSNVDIAEELTNMIESQRSYTANSKVFQTGADLMDILVNLKR
ncbi:flagellar hook protein FlgE [Mesorhizobium sp. YM1C-6-2]|uniref:flagellar hook protein FlgE n=1 Tax=Mesorhizobium sp. YM1C-6-2 TaxID=1827501 RepID=UPI000EF28C1A|nr:flagellar hook protein FlgE [Mesorhizobium sp. YM1C-6-2]RLP26137.1 flagellar hook protein FlgE [Mesorhizobium sp. YM1C-6-2]